MEMAQVLGFWVIAAVLVCTPGADWAFAISAGVARRPIVPPIAGVLAGYLVVILLIALGLGALVAATPAVLTALTLVGAAYLVWLGITTIMRPAAAPAVEAGDPVASAESGASAASAASGWRSFLRGAGTSGLNPKGLLLLLALLPQFTVASAPVAMPLQVMALGGLHVLNCAVVYTAVALFAKHVLAARPAVAAVVTKCSGGAMLLVGLLLVAEQVAAIV